MIRAHEFKRHDTGYPLRVLLTDSDGAPLDLTSATSLRFTMIPLAGGTAKVDAAATAENAAAGLVRYNFQSADVDTSGTFLGEFEVVLPSLGKITFPPQRGAYIPIVIGEDLNNT